MKGINAWFARGHNKADGYLTIQDDKGVPITYQGVTFKRIPVTSGQAGFYSTDWVSGKSPTPRGKWRLWTFCYQRGQNPTGTDKIGQFYPISSGENSQFIYSLDGKHLRDAVGLHPDNKWKGTIGCTAVREDLYNEYFVPLAAFLDYLHSIGIKWIPYNVIGG